MLLVSYKYRFNIVYHQANTCANQTHGLKLDQTVVEIFSFNNWQH